MDILLVLSHFVHLVATVVWIGGLLLLTFGVLPSVAKPDDPITQFIDKLRKRFYPLTNLSLVALTASGMYQMSVDPNYQGMFQFSNDWSRAILLKHIAVVGMFVIGIVVQMGVLPALDRALLRVRRGRADRDTDDAPDLVAKLRQRERQLAAVNCLLGIAVLVFTAFATAI